MVIVKVVLVYRSGRLIVQVVTGGNWCQHESVLLQKDFSWPQVLMIMATVLDPFRNGSERQGKGVLLGAAAKNTKDRECCWEPVQRPYLRQNTRALPRHFLRVGSFNAASSLLRAGGDAAPLVHLLTGVFRVTKGTHFRLRPRLRWWRPEIPVSLSDYNYDDIDIWKRAVSKHLDSIGLLPKAARYMFFFFSSDVVSWEMNS